MMEDMILDWGRSIVTKEGRRLSENIRDVTGLRSCKKNRTQKNFNSKFSSLGDQRHEHTAP